MSEQFRVYMKSEADAQESAGKLGSLKINGKEVMLSRQAGNEIFAGCSIFERIDSDAVVTSSTGATAKFYDLFYNCNLVKSGMHHPDGIFWVRTPQRTHMLHEEKIPLDRVAPTVLALMGVPQPAFMKTQPVLLEEPALTAQ
jgi:bisphosphoglycerate-independent phosphoglycerate mutase (AlkP superfamily)